jgi:hypothetical protein
VKNGAKNQVRYDLELWIVKPVTSAAYPPVGSPADPWAAGEEAPSMLRVVGDEAVEDGVDAPSLLDEIIPAGAEPQARGGAEERLTSTRRPRQMYFVDPVVENNCA